LEHDRWPNPTCVVFNLSGWVRSDMLYSQKRRHLYELTTDEVTPDRWELVSDGDRLYQPFWTPLSPRPYIIPEQAIWLQQVYEQIL
jgi:hypothetical protein